MSYTETISFSYQGRPSIEAMLSGVEYGPAMTGSLRMPEDLRQKISRLSTEYLAIRWLAESPMAKGSIGGDELAVLYGELPQKIAKVIKQVATAHGRNEREIGTLTEQYMATLNYVENPVRYREGQPSLFKTIRSLIPDHLDPKTAEASSQTIACEAYRLIALESLRASGVETVELGDMLRVREAEFSNELRAATGKIYADDLTIAGGDAKTKRWADIERLRNYAKATVEPYLTR